MKKTLALIIITICMGSMAGRVGLPTEHIALPTVQGSHLICIWDQTANTWYTDFATYDNSGKFVFPVPELGKWYWVGLWDEASGQYVYSKWIGHFLTE